MKTLILILIMTISQASIAGGSQAGTIDNSRVGNLKTAANNGSGTMGGDDIGNFKSAGIGFGTMDNSQVGTLSIAGGAEANGNGQGTIKLVGGAEANAGGGGLRPDFTTIPSGGHEI